MTQVVIHGLNNNHSNNDHGDQLSLLHEMLGFDHLISIFSNFDGFFSRRLALVCKEWHRASLDPMCWQAWCAQVWWRGGLQNQLRQFDSWQAMYINRPHVRFDRLYMLERSWFQHGTGSDIAPVGTVMKAGWFRYLRFRPQGKVLYILVANPIRNLKEHHKGCKVGQYFYQRGMVNINIDMEYMDGFMQAEFVPGSRSGLLHDALKVTAYTSVYKGEPQAQKPPGVFELQPLFPKISEEGKQ